ncbi:transposase-like protein [Paraburkholderia sp. UCT70]
MPAQGRVVSHRIGGQGIVKLAPGSTNIMGHEESFRFRLAVGLGADFVQGLSISAGHHLLRGVAVLQVPVSLRMVEEMLAARGIELTYEKVRCWATKFGLAVAKRIRSTAPGRGDKWHLDEAVVTIHGRKHWLWRAVVQHGAVLDVLVQSRRDKAAAKRLMRKLLRRHGCPRVIVTDKLRSYAAANNELGLNVEHRQHKGLNNRAEASSRRAIYNDSRRSMLR